MDSVRWATAKAGLAMRSVYVEGLSFIRLWPRVRRDVKGWLTGDDALLLYGLARRGPGTGAIVEIGSAWGKSTIFLASGAKRARREKVYAIDPHTGDPWYLSETNARGFSSLASFQANTRRFGVQDWIHPVVATSTDAARTIDTGPIRLLYIDGLHTYEGAKADISDWVSRVIRGGVIVFDDYFNQNDGVGVRCAVDELLASGAVEPALQKASALVWTTKR
jgi:Methyltransferase domain